METWLISRCSTEQAFSCVEDLLRWYPQPDLLDPAHFTAAVASLLTEYPFSVAQAVCGPRGIASKLKFFPSLAEIREACEVEVAPLRRQAERYQRAKESLELAAPVEVTPEARERAVAAWEAQREDMQSGEDREAREKARAEHLARMRSVSDRMRDRELKRAGIEDGKPIGLEMRQKLILMGARFDSDEPEGNHTGDKRNAASGQILEG